MNNSASILAILTLSAFSTAAFVACGDSNTTGSTSTGTGGGDTGTSASTSTGGSLTPEAQVAKFCKDLAVPYCVSLFACCTDQMKLDLEGGTLEGCKTDFADDCPGNLSGILEQVKAGTTFLDQGLLSACVAKLDGMKGGGAACTAPPTMVMELECPAAFQGNLAPGAACDSTNLHDQSYIPCHDGVCESGKCKAFIAAGAACDPSQNNSAAAGCNYPKGELCIGTGTTGKCGPRQPVGDACGDPGHDKSFSCESLSCGPDGKCIAPTVIGVCASG